MDISFDQSIRLSAFNWLKEKTDLYGNVLSRDILAEGFYHNNQRITLVGPQGIWKPKLLDLPISITTIIDGPYNDTDMDNGIFKYKYRGIDPQHPANVGLRNLMNRKIPLIYFFQLYKNRYSVFWPIFVIGEDVNNNSFTIVVDSDLKTDNQISEEQIEYRRTYVTSQTKQRLHQSFFRERVLFAYNEQCTFCSLKHRELLDAAHIIPDSEIGGEPIVLNGLSLCKIHHAAFDSNILGVTPDYDIKVREDILNETDGPMLKYGLQSLNNKKLFLPRKRSDWPDRDRLSNRYNKFINY